ncbi:MAG: cell division protein ZipA C-terminal FtsZ-binding domain-containing protein [Pseudomonadota bacterium]|nr:cell division protein ZipA C-terminal FtsZ-binding domain-containing protein [Pseudomonadota bacterium]
MELRTALFIIGMLVIVFIAFISFHRSQQQSYKLPKKMHRFGRKNDDEVDPLFEPRQGPLTAPKPLSNEKREPRIAEADEINIQNNQKVEPAPLVIEEADKGKPESLTLDLQPSTKVVDQSPQKAIEYVALIRGAEPITRDQALGVYRQHEYTMEKPNRIFGFNITNGLWRDLEQEEQSSEYRDICLTIQMADPAGPVSESELHRFSQMSLEVAEELDRPVIFSMDFDEGIAHALELDRYRKDVDRILIISLIARSESGFTMAAIHREAEKLGLRYSEEKIYERIRINADNQAEVLFSMANMFKPGELVKDDQDSHTSGLTLFMRLVSVNSPVDVYTDMIKTARSLANRLNAILVDQETRPVNESMIMSETKAIMKIAVSMDAHEIPAGSSLARRLF